MRMRPTQFDYKNILFSSESDYDDDQTSFTFNYDSFKPVIHEAASTRCLRRTDEQPFNIDDEMTKAYQRNESRIMNESIRPIANGIYSYYNSLNILVGN